MYRSCLISHKYDTFLQTLSYYAKLVGLIRFAPMPSLKQISCCIQWVDTAAPFQEYGTQYGDGVVESFIVVPAQPQGFCIRLTSRGYISEGLAMVVFVDGNYQCNRLRLNLLPSKKGRPANRTEVDFLLRQQEKPQGDGIYLGRAWRFDNHNIGMSDNILVQPYSLTSLQFQKRLKDFKQVILMILAPLKCLCSDAERGIRPTLTTMNPLLEKTAISLRIVLLARKKTIS